MKRLIFSFFFILAFSLLTFSQSAEVITERANLRGTASQAGKVIATLSCGAEIKVIKQTGSWFLVESLEYVGWIHGNTIQFTSAHSSPPCFAPGTTYSTVTTVTKRPRTTETRVSQDTSSGAQGSVKTGATPTAICNDGTYSYSRHRSGTCSHHGGVSTWLDGSTPSSARSTNRKPSYGRTYIRGPRGGCYYINGNGNKTYVDRSLCN